MALQSVKEAVNAGDIYVRKAETKFDISELFSLPFNAVQGAMSMHGARRPCLCLVVLDVVHVCS